VFLRQPRIVLLESNVDNNPFSRIRSPPTNPLTSIFRLSAILAVVAALFSIPPAFASLGGSVASIQSDQARMQGTVRVSSTASYALHQIQTPSGLIVREYVSPAGKVFGVAWHGPFRPDLKQLLGAYFGQYQQAANASRRARHAPLIIRQPNLVVEFRGHMRDFAGRAYLPGDLPAGISAESIQ